MQSFDELYSPTRTHLIALLRRSERTIPELADELGVSGNAVRSHVSALESDGVVRETGIRREGVGKPARIYGLTAGARERLSRAYAPVLAGVVEVLEEEEGLGGVRRILREVGRRVGRSVAASGDVDARLGAARSALEALGGAVDVRRSDGRVRIQGAGCPLGAVVADHPEACVLVEALLEEVLARPVTETCDRSGDPPRCAFEAALNGG